MSYCFYFFFAGVVAQTERTTGPHFGRRRPTPDVTLDLARGARHVWHWARDLHRVIIFLWLFFFTTNSRVYTFFYCDGLVFLNFLQKMKNERKNKLRLELPMSFDFIGGKQIVKCACWRDATWNFYREFFERDFSRSRFKVWRLSLMGRSIQLEGTCCLKSALNFGESFLFWFPYLIARFQSILYFF